MRIKIHTASKMFLTNPYVVRVKHPESVSPDNQNLSVFRNLLKAAKLTINDTWGYTNPTFEIIKTNGDEISLGYLTYKLPVSVFHSYWVFTNELDALQFRLTAGENASRVHMWPTKLKYTIVEYFKDMSDT